MSGRDRSFEEFLMKTLPAYPEPSNGRGMSATERMFPIQGEHGNWHRNESGEVVDVIPQRPAGQIPWRLAVLAYNEYSRRYGTSQSLECLAERGGFGWTEFAELFIAWAIRQKEARS